MEMVEEENSENQDETKSNRSDYLTELVHKAIEPFGIYQQFVVAILCFHSFSAAIHDTIPAFHIYTPKHFKCEDDIKVSHNAKILI